MSAHMHTQDTPDLELHPLCSLFPRITGSDFDALCADIQTHGLRNSIILHDGMILDGGNRYRACKQVGVQPHFEIFGGSSAVAFVLSANLHRRHMTIGQQAAIVASAQDWANAQTVGKPKSGTSTGLDRVADRAAQSGASDKMQRLADAVVRTDPDLGAKVAHGEVSLKKAAKQIAAQKHSAEQAATVVAGTVEKREPAPSVEALATSEVVGETQELVDELEMARDVARDLAEEVETLRAASSAEGAEAEIKRLKAMLRAVEAERDMYRNKSNEMVKQIRAMQNKIAKLERPA